MRSAVIALTLMACTPLPPPPEINFPSCFEQELVDYQAEVPELCPDPEEVFEASHYTAGVAESSVSDYFGYKVVYVLDTALSVQGCLAVGVVFITEQVIVISSSGYPIPTTRHEMFHVSLDSTKGDPDYYHRDSRWALIN